MMASGRWWIWQARSRPLKRCSTCPLPGITSGFTRSLTPRMSMPPDILTFLLRGGILNVDERKAKGLWPNERLRYSEVLDHLVGVILLDHCSFVSQITGLLVGHSFRKPLLPLDDAHQMIKHL